MDSDNAVLLLNSCIEKFKSDSLTQVKNVGYVFDVFAVSQIIKDYEISLSDIEDSIVDDYDDGGIDSFIILHNGQYIRDTDDLEDLQLNKNSTIQLYIIQVKSAESFTQDVLDQLISNIPTIFELKLKEKELIAVFNSKLVNKLITFRNLWEKAYPFHASLFINYIYVSKGNTKFLMGSKRIVRKSEQIVKDTKNKLITGNVKFEFYGAGEILNLYQKSRSTQRILKFVNEYIHFNLQNEDTGFVGLVQLTDFYNFITDNKKILEYLFEENIRHYRGSVDVNKKIMYTLENPSDQDFWWLNNGITIIASYCIPGQSKLNIENAQIVNGLQTSFTISDYFKVKDTLKDNRSLLVKVIQTKNRETIDKIISATNSQNQVKAAQLRATEDFQRKLETFFVNKDYYYERRKNFYKNQGKPQEKIFGIQDLAQYVEAIILYDPFTARTRPTSLMKDDKSYKKIFNNKINLNAYLNSYLIYQKAKGYVRDNNDRETKNMISNYTLYLARIIPAVYLKETYYTSMDITSINIEKIDEEILLSSSQILLKTIKDYLKKNKESNIISAAKTKRYNDKINSILWNKYNKNRKKSK